MRFIALDVMPSIKKVDPSLNENGMSWWLLMNNIIDPPILEDMIKRELTAISARWRSDWTGFDGRTLQFEINKLIEAIDTKNVDFKMHSEFNKEEGIE